MNSPYSSDRVPPGHLAGLDYGRQWPVQHLNRVCGGSGKAGMTASTQGLRKAITLRYAVALYVSSVLGSGVLVLPGLAAQLAGPGSLIAWVLLSIVSYPFAYTFASLSARKPEAGGIYSFTKEGFGLRIATVTGSLFAPWFIPGGPAVMF